MKNAANKLLFSVPLSANINYSSKNPFSAPEGHRRVPLKQ